MRAKIAVVCVALFANAIGTVFAADMPVAPKAPPPAAAFNWSGPYIGAHAGYGWGSTHQFGEGAASPSFDYDGFVGGLTAGYNWRSGAWVLGLEADILFGKISGVLPNGPTWGCGPILPADCHNRVEWFGTVRGRVGYAFDHFLPYATAGLAYGRVYGDFTSCAVDCIEGTKTGWTAGAGIEWAFAPNWSAKLEYLFVDLGTFRRPVLGGELGVDTEFNVIRGGINYRFATGKAPAAVVTKY